MTDKINYQGGCACGAVRFEAKGQPLRVANCHCSKCRHATGAAFATFVDFARNSVVFSGQRSAYVSSPGVNRWYCAACGSPLAYEGEQSADETNLFIGAFDSPKFFEPTEISSEDEALPWVKKRLQSQ